MTASSQDVLTYVQELESTGFSHDQAIAIAGGFVNIMDQRLEKLVTRTHFDAAMSSVAGRFGAVDQRFDAVDQRFDAVDHRFAMVDFRLRNVEEGVGKLAGVPSDLKLHTWMLALITVVLVIPQLQEWFAP